jgi:hypothetical protein
MGCRVERQGQIRYDGFGKASVDLADAGLDGGDTGLQRLAIGFVQPVGVVSENGK